MSPVTQTLTTEATEAFALLDKDSTGSIKTKDMGFLLRSLGLELSPTDVKEMERNADPFSSGFVKQADFFRQLEPASVIAQRAKTETRMALKEMAVGLARLFENKRTSDGSVSAREFRLALTRVGEKLSDDEFAEMCRDLKADANGRINVDSLSDLILA